MAVTYPQGECFFKKSGLESETKGRFSAEDPYQFYSTLLVEMIWNKEAHHGSKECNNPHGHPHKRSDYKIVYGSNWNTAYGNWAQLPFSYGHYTQPSRRVQHALCTNGNRFKKRENGDAYESWFMFVPMPTREEEWVFIDRLCTIRAVYIPVAHEASEKHPELCTYLHVRFNSLKEVNLKHYKDKTPDVHAEMFDFEQVDESITTVPCHETYGLDIDKQTALGLNITLIVTTLIIPRKMRKHDAFSSGAIILVDSSLIPVARVQQKFSETSMANWITVAGENNGLTIEWGKEDYKAPWFLNYFKNAMAMSAGMIPIIGPLIAAGVSIGMEAIINPDGVMDELRQQIPGFQLHEGLIEEFKNVAGLCRENLKLPEKKVAPMTIAIKLPPGDAITAQPVEPSKEEAQQEEKGDDEETSKDEIEVPAYKALSKAEFDATVERRLREILVDRLMDQVGKTSKDMPKLKSLDDWDEFTAKLAKVPGINELNKLHKLLREPPKEHHNATVPELLELAEESQWKEPAKRIWKYQFTDRMIQAIRAENESMIKDIVMTEATRGEVERADDDYNFGKEHSEKLVNRYVTKPKKAAKVA